MKRNSVGLTLLLTLVATVAVIWLIIDRDRDRRELRPVSDQESKLNAVETETLPRQQAAVQAPKRYSRPEQESKNPLAPPPSEALYEEAKNNPHQTPPSLIRFAARLGEQMNEALKSEGQASELFGELEHCVLPDRPKKLTQSVQALCLINAETLGSQFSKLGTRYERLLRQTDQSVVRLAHQTRQATGEVR